MKKISVIVPVLNEEAALPRFLAHLKDFQGVEIVIVDGGSVDRTPSLLRAWASSPERVVLLSERGRARQMNAGAKRAAGDVFLFLHVDSLLPRKGVEAIIDALKSPGIVGGAFRFKVDSRHLLLRIIEKMAHLRSRLFKLPYGDQGIFVRREVFETLQGYADLPLMEDVDFIRRLRRAGRVALLQEAVTTSPRRWLREGIYYTSVRNLVLLSLYLMGISPRRLARWYRSEEEEARGD